MAMYKIIECDISKLDTLPIVHGQVIHCYNGEIYYDSSKGTRLRTSGNVILINTEAEKDTIINPDIEKLYFCLESGIIYRFTGEVWENIIYNLLDLNIHDFVAEVAISGYYNDLIDKPGIVTHDTDGLMSKGDKVALDTLVETGGGGSVDPTQFSPVAFSGSYHDLTNKLELVTQELDGLMSKEDKQKIDNIGGSFATVATSGDYNDLENKPVNATQLTDGLLSKEDKQKIDNIGDSFATVATTGNYDDLIGAPTFATPEEALAGTETEKIISPNTLMSTIVETSGEIVNYSYTALGGELSIELPVDLVTEDDILIIFKGTGKMKSTDYNLINNNLIFENPLTAQDELMLLVLSPTINFSTGDTNKLSSLIPKIIDDITVQVNAGDNIKTVSARAAKLLYQLVKSLSSVAFSGNYNDLLNIPENIATKEYVIATFNSISTAGKTGQYADLLNKPELANWTRDGFISSDDKCKLDNLHSVASTGNYNELRNKPTRANSIKDGFMSKEDKIKLDAMDGSIDLSILAPVATSGSYNDLTDKPQNATNVSDGLLSKEDKAKLDGMDNLSILSPVATSGSYNDLTDKPQNATNVSDGLLSKEDKAKLDNLNMNYDDLVDKPTNATTTKAGLMSPMDKLKLNSLIEGSGGGTGSDINLDVFADVALSGDYNDLSNKPTNATQDNSGFMSKEDKTKLDNIGDSLATVATSGNYNDLTNKPTNATQANSGLMSPTDKQKLDNLNMNYDDLVNKPTRVTPTKDGFMSKEDKTKLDNMDGSIDTSIFADVALSGDYNDLLNTPTNHITQTIFNQVINEIYGTNLPTDFNSMAKIANILGDDKDVITNLVDSIASKVTAEEGKSLISTAKLTQIDTNTQAISLLRNNLEVVDDVITDDDTKALSARQGMLMAERISGVLTRDEIINRLGETWTEAIKPELDVNYYGVCYGRDRFVTIAHNSNKLVWSDNGKDFFEASIPLTLPWTKICYGNGIYVALAYSNTNANVIAYSIDNALTWQIAALPYAALWKSVEYVNNKFVAIPERNNKIAISDNGRQWTEVNLLTGGDTFSTVIGDNKLVLVQRDKVLFTEDFITFTTQVLPLSDTWYTSSYGDNMFVLFGTTDKILTSKNLTLWIEQQIPISKTFYASSYADGAFMAISYELNPTVIYSIDGCKSWTKVENTITGHIQALTYGMSKFVIVGENNTIIYTVFGLDERVSLQLDKIYAIVEKVVTVEVIDNKIAEIPNASSTQDGFMSKEDKIKFDSMPSYLIGSRIRWIFKPTQATNTIDLRTSGIDLSNKLIRMYQDNLEIFEVDINELAEFQTQCYTKDENNIITLPWELDVEDYIVFIFDELYVNQN